MRHFTVQQILDQKVEVLNRHWLPVKTTTVREAVCLIVAGKADAVAVDERTFPVRSVRLTVEVTPFVVLRDAGPQKHWKPGQPSRRRILDRDGHTCQYCGVRATTIDHVFPASRGGGNTWTNLVAACERCNTLKGDRTPEEADMPLRCTPKPPAHPIYKLAQQH